MAIFHLSAKAISRSAGRSATAAAAYRAGVAITDARTGELHDYRRKRGVESADLVLPDDAPAWAADRARLWNAAELAERRKDACVAREYEVALPAELSPEARRQLALDFARDLANREGAAVDVAIHAPGRGGDDRNHHAHLLRTTRKIDAEGLGAKLDSEKAGRNRTADLEVIRARWSEFANARLLAAGSPARIDHRSLRAQGVEQAPTKHLGPAATGFERRTGEPSRRRLDFLEAAGERLAQARQAGELERAAAASARSILDLSGDLAAARRERDAQREAQREQEREREREEQRQAQAARATQAAREAEDARTAREASLAAEARRQQQAAVERVEAPVIERMTAQELGALIAARQLPSNWAFAQEAPAFVTAEQAREALARARTEALAREARAQLEAEAWRDAHGLRARLHDSGLVPAEYLRARAQTEAEARQAADTLAPRVWQATQAAEAIRIAAERQAEIDTAPARDRLLQLEQIRQEKAAREARVQQEAQEKAAFERRFTQVAARRAQRVGGYRDEDANWQASPPLLRVVIDEYNRHPQETQARAMAHWQSDPQMVRTLSSAMEKLREPYWVPTINRTQDRGWDRER